MQYEFQVGQHYRRRDVYRVIGIPEDTKGGNWDTGYARHGDSWFVFCNVGTAGRTGHDYANEWIDRELHWRGKTGSTSNQPSIRAMTSPSTETYIFWRDNNEGPFTFAGRGRARAIEECVPVKVVWSFAEADRL